MLVTNFAIFLVRPKRFFRPARVVNTIAFVDVIAVRERKGVLQVTTENVSVCLEHKEQQLLETILYGIRLSLVPVNVRPLNFRGEDRKSDSFVFESESLARDRFISCCCSMDCLQELVDAGEAIDADLERLTPVLVVDRQLMASPLCGAMIYHASLDSELKGIEIREVEIGKIIHHFSELLRFARSVETITFEKLTFSRHDGAGREAMTKFLSALESPHFLDPRAIRFSECVFDLADSNGLMDAIVALCTRIDSFSIVGCDLQGNSLNVLFQCIFFNDCFHQISEIEFADNKNVVGLDLFIFQFMNCDWLISSKCLKEIRLVNSGSNAETLFKYIFMRENNIHFADFSRNNVIESFPDNLMLSELRFLALRGCDVKTSSLISLLKILSSRPSLGLDLSGVHINPLEDFLTQISDPAFPMTNIVVFLFNDNIMRGDDFRLLMAFLMRQKRLKHLGLSRTIKQDATVDNTINLLAALFNRRPLESCSLAAGEGSALGPKINLLFQALLAKRCCKYLDVENQNVDEAGVRCLVAMAEQTLQTLNIRGLAFNSLEQALDVAAHLCQSNELVECAWPILHVGTLLSQVPPEKRHQLNRKYELTKTTWSKRFPKESDTASYMSMLLNALNTPDNPVQADTTAGSEALKLICSSNLRQESAEISSDELGVLLAECVGGHGVSPATFSHDIQTATSFETLLCEL